MTIGKETPKLYIANKLYSSWSLRPWILLKELGIPFEEIMNPFSPEGSEKDYPNFRKFSPTGKVPCLHHNEVVVWDSLAIVEYLAENFEHVWPKNSFARAYARSAAAEMHSGFSILRNLCSMHLGVRIKLNSIPEDLKADLSRIQEIWEMGINNFGGPFLAGENFSAVDAFFAPVCFRIQTFSLPTSSVCGNYVKHMLSLSSMQAWQRDALIEPWNEPSHEQSVLANGILLQDLRKNNLPN
jgi:glutathione S-transferase